MRTIAIIGALLAGLLAGCGTGSGLRGASPTATSTSVPTSDSAHVKLCRDAAYDALPKVLALEITGVEGQRIVDKGCDGLPADQRAEILNKAKLDTLASWSEKAGS